MSTVAVTPDEPAPPAKSFPARFVGVFVSPGETFADIARSPGFLPPMIVAAIMSIAVTETMLAKIGMERIVRMSIEQSKGAANMSPQQIDQAVQQGAKIGGIIAHVAGVIGAPIFLLILAGLGLLIVNAMFGGQANFKTALSVASYAYMPLLLGGLMALGIIVFGDPEHFNPENPAPTNAGFFLNPLDTSKPLYKFATSMDLFTIWLLVLLGIGFSAAAGRKVKALNVFLVYFGMWMVWVIGKVALSALTG